LFSSRVRRRIDFKLHPPQVFQIATAALAPTRALVTLNCILKQKQLGIIGMNGQSLRNPSQGCE
jgi:hypothetical protein